MSIIYLRGQWSNVPNNCVSKFLKIGLSSAKIVDPDHFIWVFTIYKSTWVSRIQCIKVISELVIILLKAGSFT